MTRLVLILPAVLLCSACEGAVKTQYAALAHTDSVRADSIQNIQSALLDEVTSSAQFVNDLNTQMGKLSVPPTLKVSERVDKESPASDMKAERVAVTQRISELVARFDSSQARVATLRERARSLAAHDSSLAAQVAHYETAMAELRHTFDQERAQLQATIDQQTTQIASLHSTIDTVTRANAQLIADSAQLADTVGQLTTEVNTAFVVVGTKDDLVKRGILVEEGPRRFLILGSRSLEPSRTLDSTQFTRIDRLRDRVINLPDGEYRIVSRQNPQYTTPLSVKDGKIVGGLMINEPDKFWEESKFLVLVRG